MNSTIKRILREQYGEGHNECGIIYYEDSSYDDSLIGHNIRDSVVNHPEETLELINKDKQIIPIDKTLYSTQDYIDLDFVYGLNDEVHGQSDIHLLDINGDLFIIDGHHRVCRDRMGGRDSQAYIWGDNDITLIDCVFYGIGDC